jgi:hypothetical protein
MLEPFYRFGGRRSAFDRSYQPVPLEAQAAIRAIECENIFGRYSHIRWLFWTEVPYSHAKMAPDIWVRYLRCVLVRREATRRDEAGPGWLDPVDRSGNGRSPACPAPGKCAVADPGNPI